MPGPPAHAALSKIQERIAQSTKYSDDSIAGVLMASFEKFFEASKAGAAWLRDYITAIKNGRFHPFTAVERKAREATRNEPWGPTGTQLAELTQLAETDENCQVSTPLLIW